MIGLCFFVYLNLIPPWLDIYDFLFFKRPCVCVGQKQTKKFVYIVTSMQFLLYLLNSYSYVLLKLKHPFLLQKIWM
jgi:hypothetical protein